MKHSRVIDYAIYIGVSLAFCAAALLPVLLGVNTDAYWWQFWTGICTLAVVGWLAEKLRLWRKTAQFWLFLIFVALTSAWCGWWLHHVHYAGGTHLITILIVPVVVALEAAFRAFTKAAPKS